MKHYSVLLNETIESLNIDPNGIYVDGTLGRGGHSLKIVEKLKDGKLIAFDRDATALEESKEVLKDYLDKIIFVHDNFINLKHDLNELGIAKIDGLILDLGVSSPQFDEGERGFSYRFDAKLDMRMDQSQSLSAYTIVNTYSYEDLVTVLSRYGEEPFAKQIARNIEKSRNHKPIETTFELVDIIKSSLPSKVLNKKGHPAKKTFQALRIEVNQELDSLKNGLKDAIQMLKKNGRCCVITFQSLEDRIVKECFMEVSKEDDTDPSIPLLPSQIKQPDYRRVNRKPILASQKELEENNRSHSAKLRVLERIKD